MIAAAVPIPLTTHAQGVVWLPETGYVRAGADGFIERIVATPGQRVAQGALLVESVETTLAARIAALGARAEELETRYASEQFTKRSDAEVTLLELGHARAELGREMLRQAQLAVRSQTEGTFSVAAAENLPGRFVKEGEILGYVLPERGNIVRVSVDQDDIELVRRRLLRATSKLPGHLDETYRLTMLREVPAAQSELPSKALTAAGGGTSPTDPRDPKGLKSLRRLFQFDVEMAPEAPQAAFGSRVHVRFEHPAEPLGAQLYRRLRQLLLSRLHA